MTSQEQKAILAIAIHAAFADGAKDEREREEVRRVAENLADESGDVDLPRLYQDVLFKRLPLNSVTAMITDTGQRQFVYEMAIIPLQIKMVYGIGKAHGVALDQGHIKEFIAAAGVGLTSQYLEQFGRKLLGGLLGKAAGKAFGKAGDAATGMAFSFATTFALGQVARRYYAGGRLMNTALLRETFQGLLGPAKQLQAQYLPQIQQKAATLDAGQVMAMMRT